MDGRSRWNDKAYVNWKKHVFDTGITADCQAALKRAAAKVVHPNAVRMLAGIQSLDRHLVLLDKENVHAVATDEKPEFNLTRRRWRLAVPNSHFLQNRSGALFVHPTTVWALYDGKHYFGFKCDHKEPDKMPVAEANDGKKNIRRASLRFLEGSGRASVISRRWSSIRSTTAIAVRPVVWTSQAVRTATGWAGWSR